MSTERKDAVVHLVQEASGDPAWKYTVTYGLTDDEAADLLVSTLTYMYETELNYELDQRGNFPFVPVVVLWSRLGDVEFCTRADFDALLESMSDKNRIEMDYRPKPKKQPYKVLLQPQWVRLARHG